MKQCAAALFLLIFFAPISSHAFTNSPDFIAPTAALDSGRANRSALRDDFLKADRISRDSKKGTVKAVGNVKLRYGEYIVEADELTYHEISGQIIADGHVRIFAPDGMVYTAKRTDITSQIDQSIAREIFAITSDKRYIWASDYIQNGDITTLFNVTYTTCKPCEEDPTKAPIWRVRSEEVTEDKGTKKREYRRNQLEFFGQPVLHIPYFFTPTEEANRKSGFLRPSVKGQEELGYGFSMPYHWAIDPSYDLTLTPTVYEGKAALLQLNWRQKLKQGSYNVNLYGAYQLDKERFTNTEDQVDSRLALTSEGQMKINSMWNWGWEAAYTSDRRFSTLYGLDLPSYLTNSLWLEGESKDSFARLEVTDYASNNTVDSNEVLPSTLPSIRYRKNLLGDKNSTHDLTLVVDGKAIQRDRLQTGDRAGAVSGFAGNINRLTGDLSWQYRHITNNGIVATPFAYAKTDILSYDLDDASAGSYIAETQATHLRAMPALGLDLRMPMLAGSGEKKQTLTPIVQLIARPDEMSAGELPNETSQSLTLDASNLFAWDKFSGYDRQEGGTRVNYGIDYTAQLSQDTHLGVTLGQSYHIAGQNSFAISDLSVLAPDSGLQNDLSDIVVRTQIDHKTDIMDGRSLALKWDNDVLLDPETAQVNSWQTTASAKSGRISTNLQYAYAPERTELGLDERSEISGRLSVGFAEGWTARASSRYSLSGESWLGRSAALNYRDECTIFGASISESFDSNGDTTGYTYRLNLVLQSLGEVEHTQKILVE